MAKPKVPSGGTRARGRDRGTDRLRLFEALKRMLKSRGVTYRELARRLRLSESGVKKLFAHEDCTLSRLEAIAHAGGLSLADVFQAAARPPFEHVALSDAQQSALLAQPELLDVFWKLTVERWSAAQVARGLGLSDAAVRRRVSELDRLDLVILEQPGDRLRLRYGDLVQWLPRGALLDALHERWGRDVLDRARAPGAAALLRLHQLALRPDTRAELESELARTLDAFLRRARAEQLASAADEAPPCGVLLALAPGSFVRPRGPRAR